MYEQSEVHSQDISAQDQDKQSKTSYTLKVEHSTIEKKIAKLTQRKLNVNDTVSLGLWYWAIFQVNATEKKRNSPGTELINKI